MGVFVAKQKTAEPNKTAVSNACRKDGDDFDCAILPRSWHNSPGRFPPMLTKLHVRNFKRFEAIEFDLERSVVLIGPNNSGKTTALQALARLGIWGCADGRKNGAAPQGLPSAPACRSTAAI